MKTRAAAALGLLAIAAAPALPALATTRTVRVGAFYFEDSTRGDGQVVVAKGDRITFVFEGNRAHTATVGGLFDSGIKEPGQRYTTPLLTKVGTYTLFCQVHGAPQHGTRLVIRAAAAPKPTPTRARPAPSPTHRTSPRPSPTPSPAPTPSPRPTPSPTGSPAAASSPPPPSSPRAVVVPTVSPTPSTTFTPPDVAPAVALDDGTSWVAPTAIVLLAAALGAAAIAIGRRRRS